ncbi:hypothetical protein LO80_07370 [Candidatus Francisella endociliophora]|uniref:Amidinotransferase n=1 Tax=Candidatus Francisella endociliophora TaxID=653937 RepID=A0A097EQF8_9GAMM|nr:arginine deiminase-related protein [Francisella sp. FSC1006]AIT09803.1 hypothetical protein LO80_07370 [Francisella sp. FSC1006]
MPVETSDTVLMVDPEYFATATFDTDIDNKSFQRKVSIKGKAIQALAKEEFYEMVNYIRAQNIKVIIMKSPKDAPDAVFTNDWLSTHVIDGKPYVFVYPMYAESRRKEVQVKELLAALKANTGITYQVKDFRGDYSKALEGNASLVFDNCTKKIFLSKSSRADETVAQQVADELGFELICFTAYDHTDKPVFQTTQMLSIGEKLIFVCSEAIKCDKEREIILKVLEKSNKTIIDVSIGQIFLRCCNSLEVKNKQGKNYLILSAMADMGFTKEQKEAIDKYCTRLPCNVKTIEDLGGGTARCMVAEILKP